MVVVVLLLVWGFTDVRHRADLDPQNLRTHRTDFTVYTEAGAAFFDGRDPYAVTNPAGLYYLYPPMLALLVAPLHALPTSWQGVTWFLLSLLMVVGCLSECRKIVRQTQDTFQGTHHLPGWIAIATAAAVVVPFLDTLQRGQVGIAVLWPLLMGFRLLSETQERFSGFWGGILLALPVVLKVTPALPVATLLFQQFIAAVRTERSPFARRHFVQCVSGVTVGLIVFLLVVPTILIGWDNNLRHLKTWYTDVIANEHFGETHQISYHDAHNQSLDNALHLLGIWVADTVTGEADARDTSPSTAPPLPRPMDAPIVKAILVAPRVVLALLLIIVAVRWHGETTGVGRVAVFGLACAMSLALSPITWRHHFVMLLPGILLLPWALYEAYRSVARGLAMLAATLVLGQYLTRGLAANLTGRLGLLGIGLAIWCLVASISLLRMKQVRLPTSTVPTPSLKGADPIAPYVTSFLRR